jgi:hypothetical protein
MPGSLIKIDEEIVSSAVASVELGGANWDSSYDVYVFQAHNITVDTPNAYYGLRVLKSGVADSTANYDFATKQLYATTTFANRYVLNDTQAYANASYLGTDTGETAQFTMYLFNFNNAEYSFGTIEDVIRQNDGTLTGLAGGFTHTVASASNGISILISSGNITAGNFTLYGLSN